MTVARLFRTTAFTAVAVGVPVLEEPDGDGAGGMNLYWLPRRRFNWARLR